LTSFNPVRYIGCPMRRATFLLLFLFSATFAASAQERPAITGIAFVRMYTADVPVSAAFYSNTLGFGHVESKGIARYSVNDLQWLEVEPLPNPAPVSRLAAVAFTTRNTAALQNYLKAHSVAITQPLAHGTFGVRDPEGNLILFVQQGDKPSGFPKPSSSATSRRIIHAGFLVKDAAAEDRFYREILGFRPYWHGGGKDNSTDWSSLQVPDGTDWIEYMLNSGPNPSAHQLGVMNHFSLGVTHMNDAIQALARNHCEGPNCTNSKMGRDGKVQLNLYDPDLTRVEFMEFLPSGTICCSPFTGKQPTETESR
jgi:catechol 2,3-dioxygenase-like lactoylglutathione lyase family enzyme